MDWEGWEEESQWHASERVRHEDRETKSVAHKRRGPTPQVASQGRHLHTQRAIGAPRSLACPFFMFPAPPPSSPDSFSVCVWCSLWLGPARLGWRVAGVPVASPAGSVQRRPRPLFTRLGRAGRQATWTTPCHQKKDRIRISCLWHCLGGMDEVKGWGCLQPREAGDQCVLVACQSAAAAVVVAVAVDLYCCRFGKLATPQLSKWSSSSSKMR